MKYFKVAIRIKVVYLLIRAIFIRPFGRSRCSVSVTESHSQSSVAVGNLKWSPIGTFANIVLVIIFV